MTEEIKGQGKVYQLVNLIMGSFMYYKPKPKYLNKQHTHQNNLRKILNEKVVSKKEFIDCHKTLLEMKYIEGYNQALNDYQSVLNDVINEEVFLNMLKTIAEVDDGE